MCKFLRSVFLCVLIIGTSSLFAEVTKHCDIPTPNLKSLKLKTAEDCKKVCEDDEACKAMVFISGWNNCQLKTKTKKQFTIKMYSAQRNLDPKTSDKEPFIKEGYDLDMPCCDMKKFMLNTVEECRSKCLADDQCKAFTLIEGYHTCWLKSDHKRTIDKVFHCWVKPSSANSPKL